MRMEFTTKGISWSVSTEFPKPQKSCPLLLKKDLIGRFITATEENSTQLWENKKKFHFFNQALDDLNLAYANSKDLVPSAQLTAGNITYIKNTLSNEREKLL